MAFTRATLTGYMQSKRHVVDVDKEQITPDTAAASPPAGKRICRHCCTEKSAAKGAPARCGLVSTTISTCVENYVVSPQRVNSSPALCSLRDYSRTVTAVQDQFVIQRAYAANTLSPDPVSRGIHQAPALDLPVMKRFR